MKRALLIGLALIMSLSLIAAAKSDLTLGTGGTAGTYFPFGGVIANIVSKSNPDLINMNAVSTGASVANINGIKNGDFDLGLLQNDNTFQAYNGTVGSAFEGKAFKGIATICNLYPEAVHVIVRYDSDIKSVADLKGRKVSVGAAASGTEANARQIFEAYGMTYADIKAEFIDFATSAAKFKDGGIEAFFVTGGIPTAAITEVGITHKIRVLSLEADKIKALQAKYPFFAEVTIPASAYGKNQPDSAKSVAIMAVLGCATTLSNDIVYAITKTIFERQADIASGHAKGAFINIDTAINGLGAPLHPGAVKYYREKGIIK
jgi:hypothetical protein